MAINDTGAGNGAEGRGFVAALLRGLGFKPSGAAAGEGQAALHKGLEEVIVEHEGTAAAFSPTQREILANLVEFGQLRVDDVMVPRADVIAIDITTSFDEAMDVFRDAAHSRLPVYRGTLDDPAGMVHIKDMMAILAERSDNGVEHERPALSKIAREVLCVPPSMPLADLLVRMQTSHIHMALVIDEYGGTDGLLTIEDLVEEIVGEIEDEHDVDTSPRLIHVPDGTFLADARIEIPEFEERTGIELTPDDWEEDVDTLGGLVFSLLGRVPQRGEVVRHPRGLEIQVVDADPRRVKRLRVCPQPTKMGERASGRGTNGAERQERPVGERRPKDTD